MNWRSLTLSISFAWYQNNRSKSKNMRELELDIANQDQPVKRMIRPAIQTKCLVNIQNNATFCNQHKMGHFAQQTPQSRYTVKQKQSQTSQSQSFILSKMSLISTDQDSKEQFVDHSPTITYQCGIIFKGIFKNGKKVKGHFKFTNGFEYEGACNQNHFQGEGSLIFPSGKVIFGLWKQSNLQSPAKIYYPTGEIYFGSVKNYKKHGFGKIFFNGSQKFEGEFRNGSITGQGTYFVNQQPVQSGIWIDGQIVEAQKLKSLQKLSQQQLYLFKSSTKQLNTNKSKKQSNQFSSSDFPLSAEDDIV